MNVRITPCTECRKNRRKCVRPNFSPECLRCKRLGKICKQPTKQQDQPQQESTEMDRTQDIIKLEKQVAQLEEAIRYMELQLGMCRISSSSSSRSSSPEPANAMIQNLFQSWKCKIADGTFQIETGIRNISQLLQFNTSISYLSPINYDSSASSVSSDDSYYRGRDAGIVLNFEKEVNGSLIPFTITLMANTITSAPSTIPTALLVPSALLLDPTPLIDQLVKTYFSCNNIYSPLVHERSYRDKMASIQDPLTDPVTLSICSYVCSTPCPALSFTPRERRNMGDFFYAKARDIILDQFDIPEKQLETAMSINLLMQYMHITLKIGEARRLVSLAYQILVGLRNNYPDLQVPTNVDDVTTDPSYYEQEAEEEPIENVDKVLLARHLTVAAVLSRLLDYIVSDSSDKRGFYFPSWAYVADEPENTKRFVRSQNWLIRLHNHKFVSNFLFNIHRLQLGKSCAFSFESILVMEELIKEYTTKVPSDIRLCADMNNKRMCFEAIDKTRDPVLLVNFMHFHILQMSVYSCLLRPRALSDQGQQILSLVQEHSLSKALASCQLLLRAIHRLAVTDQSSCNYLISASEYLFHAMDVLIILAMSPNKQTALEAGAMMKSCLSELQMIGAAQGNHIPEGDTAPLDKKRFLMKDGKFDIEYYDKFPHPWFAIMYDASHFISSQ
ncbi:hypothetical protein V8B55DRAFT_1528379 [Mucor lusitanicus]|uniref:Zn(2)-C6 fungal-type domain-containing protein n=1 Tax=Mucor circinelloides f. lusitanicus TaxID=29924 RepID=A0A8H4F089_MUCCL|nr:hypothetical protein FB192DRAFT_1437519 [Mucor lusitanicus]